MSCLHNLVTVCFACAAVIITKNSRVAYQTTAFLTQTMHFVEFLIRSRESETKYQTICVATYLLINLFML